MDELWYLDGLATAPRRARSTYYRSEEERKYTQTTTHKTYLAPSTVRQRAAAEVSKPSGPSSKEGQARGQGGLILRRTLGTSSSWYPQRWVRGEGPPVVVLGLPTKRATWPARFPPTRSRATLVSSSFADTVSRDDPSCVSGHAAFPSA